MWDTIVIFFHNPQKRSSLKTGLNFNMQKLLHSRNYILIAIIAAQHMYFDY